MARKKRKSVGSRRKKKSKVALRKKSQATAKKRKLRSRRRRSLGEKVSRAYRTVVDTVKGTDRLRNKMELPASSETE